MKNIVPLFLLGGIGLVAYVLSTKKKTGLSDLDLSPKTTTEKAESSNITPTAKEERYQMSMPEEHGY